MIIWSQLGSKEEKWKQKILIIALTLLNFEHHDDGQL